MVHLGDEAQVVAHFSPFGDSVSMMQDRCMICTVRIIGSEIILDAQMELLGDTGHVESCFGPFGDGVSVGDKQVHGLCHRLRNYFGCTDCTSR